MFAVELTLCKESLIFDVRDMLRCSFILSEMLIDATMNIYTVVYGRLTKKTLAVEFLFFESSNYGHVWTVSKIYPPVFRP